MTYITIDSLRKTVTELLVTWKVPCEQAVVIADTIVYAHKHEKHTHGITRLPIYKKKIDNGLMSADTKIEIVQDGPAFSVIDCQNGFGQIAASFAMKNAMEKAKLYGIGACFVRNSNNFGVAGYFGNMAADEGMVGMMITSSGPAIAPEGGTKSIFGTNPFCCSFPTPTGNITLDMAMSAVARGKIRLAEKNNEKIPYGWAVDKDGKPTDDPTMALAGNMLAIGGVKGFGLAMVIDMLAGLLSGSAYGGNIKPLAAEDDFSRHGHMSFVIDIKQLLSKEEYDQKINEFVRNIKQCGEAGNVYLPGERSREKAVQNSEVVLLKEKQVKDLEELALEYQLAAKLEVVNKYT